MRNRVLLLCLAAATTGCSQATLQASYVPNPVLLGPVDRIGGHRAADASPQIVRRIETEVNDFVSVTNDEKKIGNTVVVTRTTSAYHAGSGVVTNEVLSATEGRADRDVRIDAVPLGAWAMVSSGAAMAERWVGLRGRVVEVRRDR